MTPGETEAAAASADERGHELAEALEYQAATRAVLGIIGGSPEEAQPVFTLIAQSAARLCKAQFCHVYRFDGALIHFVAAHGLAAEALKAIQTAYPMPPGRGSAAARAITSGALAQIPDVDADPDYTHGTVARAVNFHSVAAVPMLKAGKPIGAIAVARTPTGLFPERQIELLHTFADQAVIAVENARLFQEARAQARDLGEMLEFQAATGEVLGIINRSMGDAQPVFDLIAESAARLCKAQFCHVYRFDGELIHFVAAHGLNPGALKAIQDAYPMPPGRGSAAARAITSGTLAEIEDIEADPDYTHGAAARAINFRSVAAVPMLKDGKPVGAIAMARTETGRFPQRQIDLLRTFAEQAVIAVENLRLFHVVEARTQDLTEALAFQTATSEVLGVISRSMHDAQPVFDMIAESAARLLDVTDAEIYCVEGELLRLVAKHGPSRQWPIGSTRAINRDWVTGRAVIDRAMIHIPDLQAAGDEFAQGAAFAKQYGHRTTLATPLLRDGKAIGAILIRRLEVRPLAEKQTALLATFADQAAIGFENARMVREIQDKSREVERQAAQLAEWNATLEARVAEQVAQLGRMSKLTRFLSPKVSDLIMSGHADDPLKTRRVEITVVYMDLRGFTAFTETADPEEVMGVLRQYHAELGREIIAYDGTIEHFAGDGVMIIFNDPVPVEHHELQAIRMSLAVRDAMKELTAGWKKRGYALGFGAGVAGGYATIGTIGFEERLDYGAIGTVCNLSARLCGEAADGQILISPRIFAKVEDQIQAETVGELTLKGFARPVHAHNVLAAR